MLPTLPWPGTKATAGALGAPQHAHDLVVIGGQQRALVDRHVRRGRVRPRLGAMDGHGVDRPCRRLLERREGRRVGRPEDYFASGRADGEHRHLLYEDDGQDRTGVRLQAQARECGFAIASVSSPVCLFAWPWVGTLAVSTRCVRVACRRRLQRQLGHVDHLLPLVASTAAVQQPQRRHEAVHHERSCGRVWARWTHGVARARARVWVGGRGRSASPSARPHGHRP